jgi:hypothetical protein
MEFGNIPAQNGTRYAASTCFHPVPFFPGIRKLSGEKWKRRQDWTGFSFSVSTPNSSTELQRAWHKNDFQDNRANNQSARRFHGLSRGYCFHIFVPQLKERCCFLCTTFETIRYYVNTAVSKIKLSKHRRVLASIQKQGRPFKIIQQCLQMCKKIHQDGGKNRQENLTKL